jgi:hypothetical protein
MKGALMNFNKLIIATNNLTIATENATQSMKEFGAELKSVESRYHPVVWFFIKLWIYLEK